MLNLINKTIVFEPANFIASLKYMGIGMLGVFMIIGIIILATYGISKFALGKKTIKKDAEK